MNNAKTKGVSFFIDMRDSSEIKTNKKEIYTIFYNKFRGIEINSSMVEDLELKSTSLNYKSFIGDAAFLHFKGDLSDETLNLIIKIESMTKDVENEIDEEFGLAVNFGIGISYGKYENIEGNTGEGNLAVPLSEYIDYASKSSNIARKNSNLYFALKLKPIDDPNTNKDLKEKIKEDDRFENMTSSNGRNFRFSTK